jgi:hypothetical protein
MVSSRRSIVHRTFHFSQYSTDKPIVFFLALPLKRSVTQPDSVNLNQPNLPQPNPSLPHPTKTSEPNPTK